MCSLWLGVLYKCELLIVVLSSNLCEKVPFKCCISPNLHTFLTVELAFSGFYIAYKQTDDDTSEFVDSIKVISKYLSTAYPVIMYGDGLDRKKLGQNILSL